MSTTAPRLRHRSSRVTPAVLTALVLVAVGGLAGTAAVLRLAGSTWPAPAQAVGDFLTATRWGSPTWLAVCIAVGVLGLVLLVAAVKRGGVNASRLVPPVELSPTEAELVITRRGIARLAAARADEVDGVESVSVQVDGRRVRLRVGSTSQQRDAIAADVTDRVGEALQAAGITPAPRVTTTVKTKEI